MDIIEYKKKLVKRYGKKILTKEIDGKKYVDSDFMNWLIDGMMADDERMAKLNDEMGRMIAHAKSLPPDLPDGPAFDEGADVKKFTAPFVAPAAVADDENDLFRRGA